MLESALSSAVIALTVTTVVLIGAGRRPWSGLLIRLAAPVVVIGLLTVLRTSPEAIAVGAAITGVGLLLPRNWYAAGAWFFGSLVAAFTLYATFLVQATALLADQPLSAGLGVILLVLEIGAMSLLASSAFEMVDGLCTSSTDLALPPPPAGWPLVCLQVPTYNEPPELVIQTIRSLVALDYTALRIQVVDNNTTDVALWRPVEMECERLRAGGWRVEFVHLPEWPGYKAGALNWGLAHLPMGVEIVGIVEY